MVGMQGTSVQPTSAIIKDIRANRIGGVLLFEYNISGTDSKVNLLKLTDGLQQAAKIPLLISIDQEGGKVNRLKTKYGFKPMPSAQVVGEINNDTFSKRVANTIATEVASVGINLNYAPVVDVLNKNCPVLGAKSRCYSSEVKIIAREASTFILAHDSANVMTCLKHFPGHGNSTTDSHLGLTDVTKTWKEDELYPYQDLIQNNKVDMVMVAHVVNKKLDPSAKPATLSKPIITDLLRTQMQYEGVVITDDMQMHAISKYYGLEQSILLAVEAGVDIVMFSNNIKGAPEYAPKNIHATIKRLVQEGKISRERIEESFRRVMKLKSTLVTE